MMETSTRLRTAACCFSFLGALGAWTHLSAQEDEPDRSLRFDWPVPSDVDITEQRAQSGRVLVAQYRVELRPAELDGELVVRRRGFQILKVDGLDVNLPQFRPVLAPMRIQMGIVPDIFIDTRGRILRVEEWESYSARFGQAVTDSVVGGALAHDHGERIHQVLEQPGTREDIELRASDFWELWVSGWLENDFNESASVQVEGKFPLPNGAVIAGPRVLQHNGPERGEPGYVRLSTESRVGGDRVVEQVVAMTRQLREMSPNSAPIAEDSIRSAEVSNASWVVLRPGTMQPLEAQSENRIIVERDAGKNEDIQRRYYKFDWK